MGVQRRASEGVDGRLSRAMRSRLAICDACLDLIQEGVLQPSADQIAERAGISRRSIFYRFKDLSELYDAVVEVGMQRCAPLLREIPVDASLRDRIDMSVDVRAQFFEGTAPFTRALAAQSLVGTTSAQARRVSLDALNRQAEDVERVFEPELSALGEDARAELIEALASVSCAPHWEVLRRSRGLSMARARGVMKRAITALLQDAR